MKNKKLNVLVLHWLRDPKEARDVLLKLLFFLKKYKPEHNYLYHDVSLPLPGYIKKIQFDAIILDVTLLCLRYPYHNKYFEFFKKHFWNLKDMNCVKIAFPQDDYDCCEVLDDWLVDWNVDIVYSPLADNPDIEVLYPKYKKIGEIKLGYTGYIDNDFFKITEKVKSFEDRKVDICYRARKLPPYFGRIGEIKWRIAEIVKDKAKLYDLNCDISTAEKDVILGEKWFEFLGNSKFTLGSLSGSSLIDPKGEIQEKIREYCSVNKNYDYSEIEKQFFPNQDIYNFTAISPRNIEAAFTMTGQILVKGPYSGILIPWEDYIPLEPDGSNFDEVFNALKDIDFVKKMIKNCYEKIISNKNLYYETLANKVINDIFEILEKRNIKRNLSKSLYIYDISKIIEKYEKEYNTKYKLYFGLLRARKEIGLMLKKFPILYNFVKKVLK